MADELDNSAGNGSDNNNGACIPQVGTSIRPMKFGRDLTTGSIPRHLIAFSLPMLAGTALQTAYSFVNAIWVGQFLGKTALAAVTVSFPVVFVLIAIGAGLTLATNILISQYWGAKDFSSIGKVVSSSCLLLGALSLILLAIGELFATHILKAMNTPDDVLAVASQYMRIFLLSLPLGFAMFLLRNMLQGIGDSSTPLYFQGGAVLLTAALDPVLMFGWLGMPNLGLNGTAWASLIAQALALVALTIMLRRRNNPVAPRLSRSGLDWQTMWLTIRIGIPSAIQQSLVSFGMVFVTSIVNSFGENSTAAFGAASRIDQLAIMPAMTVGLAVSTLAGQNIGANRHHLRIREIFFWGCLLACGLTLAISAVAVCLPAVMLRIFTTDQVVIGIGADYLRIVGACYVFLAVLFVSNGVINGSGRTLITTVCTMLSLWAFRVPVAYFLSRHMQSINGVWYAISISFVISMLLSLGYYLTGRWRTAIVHHRIMPASPSAIFGEETGEA